VGKQTFSSGGLSVTIICTAVSVRGLGKSGTLFALSYTLVETTSRWSYFLTSM